MNTQENNKSIAEFMGLKDGDKYLSPSLEETESIGLGMYVDSDEMRYHASWDWLMPVIDKVYEEVKGDMYPYYNLVTAVQDGLRERSRGATYNAVVKLIEFINQYNKTK